MRRLLLSSALVLAMAAPAFAQDDDYTEFVSKEDFFTITLPGKPVVTTGTWITEYGVVLPSKVYTIDAPHGHHVLTVVDYTPVERILPQKANETCPPGAETCLGVGDTGLGYWKNDVRGAVTYAISTLLVDKDVKVAHLMFNFMEMVGGQEIQMVNLKDQSRTSASAYMHKNRLIFAVSTTPKGWPQSETMQQSVGWLDENGRGIRYAFLYLNEPDHHAPVIPVRGQAAPAAGAARPDRIDPGAR
jgi:hypothetical protein